MALPSDDGEGHVGIGGGVDVGVAESGGVPEDGNARGGHDMADELVGAAGDDEVDEVVHGEHFGDLVAGLEQVHPAVGDGGRAGGVEDDGGKGAVGVEGLAAALEEDGVAALEAEG